MQKNARMGTQQGAVMARKPQQQVLDPEKPDVVERVNLPVLPAATDIAAIETWETSDLIRWVENQAIQMRPLRLAVGAVLWVLRERMSEQEYGRLVDRLADAFDVTASTLWRWRKTAQNHWELDDPKGSGRGVQPSRIAKGSGKSRSGLSRSRDYAETDDGSGTEGAAPEVPVQRGSDPPPTLAASTKKSATDPSSGGIGDGEPSKTGSRTARAVVRSLATFGADELAAACELAELRDARNRLNEAYEFKARLLAVNGARSLARREVQPHFKGGNR